jgi:hypothetical protein
MREIDGIVSNAYTGINLWFAPYQRLLWWNKFGTPQGYLSRTGDYLGSGDGYGLVQMWWTDSNKQAKLEQALRDSSVKLDVGPEEDRFWLEKAKTRQVAQAKPAGAN